MDLLDPVGDEPARERLVRRGVAPVSDAVLVRAGDRTITVRESIERAVVDPHWDMLRSAARAVLVRHAAWKLGLRVDPDEVRRGAAELPRALSSARLDERFVEDRLLDHALGRALTDADVAHELEERASDYDRAVITSLAMDPRRARRLGPRLSREFHALSLAHPPPRAWPRGAVFRFQLSAGAEQVFGTRVRGVAGPIAVGGAQVFVKVEARRRATLDDATRAAIRERLFEAWLTAHATDVTSPLVDGALGTLGPAPP